MKSHYQYQDISREEGIIENIFVMLIIVSSLLLTAIIANTVIKAQRYQAALNLSVRNGIRDLVTQPGQNSPNQVVQNDIYSTFYHMGLNTDSTTFSVSDPDGRCSTITITAEKIIHPLFAPNISIQLTYEQSEPVDPLSNGLNGVATCIGT